MNKWILLGCTPAASLLFCQRLGRWKVWVQEEAGQTFLVTPPYIFLTSPTGLSPAPPKHSSICHLTGFSKSGPKEILPESGYLWSSMETVSGKRRFSLLVPEVEPQKGSQPTTPPLSSQVGGSQWWKQSSGQPFLTPTSFGVFFCFFNINT